MGRDCRSIQISLVTDPRKAEHLHIAMASDDHFRHCGHTYSIRSDQA